jgi:mono/diheme cytochrome c family protein
VAGDPLNGRILFNTFQPAASFACATCHLADREDRLIGPGLLNVSIRAESRVPGMSVNDYLHTSIVSPGAFVVPEFPDGLMPANWADIYSEGEIGDLVAYLMTLR